MNLLDFRGALGAAMLTLLVSGTANAEFNSLEPNGYDEALDRCFALLQPALSTDASDVISLDVSKAELNGSWYHFEIAASIKDGAGAVKVNDYRVGCMSNRYIDAARLIDRPNQGDLLAGYELLMLD